MNNDKPIDDGGPAFPVVHAIVPQPGHYTTTPPALPGMSLRTYFAGQALAGDMASQNEETGEFTNSIQQKFLEERASLYVRMADALIAALKSHK